jgi:hypothetical protein
MIMKYKNAYVLYANESYFDIVSTCAKSIRAFSELPIIVYLLNCDLIVEVSNTITRSWECDIDTDEMEEMYIMQGKNENFYVNRSSKRIFRLIKERPKIVKDALLNFADNVCYIDSDSVATKHIDNVFNLFNKESIYPYFTNGIYEYLIMNGRGGADDPNDLTTTLEHPACDLFGINQHNRRTYRTSNIFVSGINCIDFLDEWYWLCINPKVLNNPEFYAPFQEETIANVLLWKYEFNDGLPYVYTNGSVERIDKVYKQFGFTGQTQMISDWFKIPEKEEYLLVFHGEKRIDIMKQMINKLKYV